jgi:heat shock protein HslJ
MKFVVRLLLAAMLSGTSAAAASTGRTLASETWSLVEMDGKPVVLATGQGAPSLAFDPHSSRVSGSTGCNRLTAGYAEREGLLHFTPLATTRMLCPESGVDERLFLTALEDVTRYRIDGDELTLYHGEKALLVFAPAK